MSKVRSKVPEEPGLYWYRLNGSDKWRFQEVFLKRGKLYINNGDGPVEVSRLHRHWQFAGAKPALPEQQPKEKEK